MTDQIIPFPGKHKDEKKTLPISEVELIGFLTLDDRDLYIEDEKDIAKIMAFIVREKIKIIDGDL